MKFYSKEWLRYVIKSPSCEVWLGKNKDKFFGVLILVNDYKLFDAIRNKISLQIYYFFNLLFCPSLELYLKKIKEKIFGLNGESICMQFIINNKQNMKSLSVEQLAVLPEEQGKGYGSFFVELAKERSIKLCCDKLSLLVNKNNKVACHLYIKNNFIKVN